MFSGLRFVILPFLAGHVSYTVLTLLSMFLSHLAVICLLLGGPDSLGFVCSDLEAWIAVEPSTVDQAFPCELVD